MKFYPIKIKMHLHDAEALRRAMADYPPGGHTADSFMAASILQDMRTWLEMRCIAWAGDAIHNGKKKRKHSVTLPNHKARALALYLTVLHSNNHITNDYDRVCADMIRNEITQALA